MPRKLQTPPNLGPKTASRLQAAGLNSEGELKVAGAVKAFVRVKALDPKVGLNLPWALECVLTGEPWQRVAEERRASLLLDLDEREQLRCLSSK